MIENPERFAWPFDLSKTTNTNAAVGGDVGELIIFTVPGRF